ncbi:4878_t:CDS:1, partial [Cetraspora pellucida]
SNGLAFLSLTIHYIDSSLILKNFLLDIIPITMQYTGLNMANTIILVLDEFNLTAKLLALTTDNASLMISCDALMIAELEKEFNNLNFVHYHCFAHILNLAVIKGIKLVDSSIKKLGH